MLCHTVWYQASSWCQVRTTMVVSTVSPSICSKAKYEQTARQKTSLSSCRVSSWYWGGATHPATWNNTFTARITDTRSQAAREETGRSECWFRALLKATGLLYNKPGLQNNFQPISEQAVNPVQSQQTTEDAEHILFERGRLHTEPHPPILTRMRPHRAQCRWMPCAELTTLLVSLLTCPEVREVSDLRETLGSFPKHYQM